MGYFVCALDFKSAQHNLDTKFFIVTRMDPPGVCEYVCIYFVCVCVFTKLNITAQPGPVCV